MPRNLSGVYTLPQLPFAPGTVIQSAPVNSDFSDIATALTQSVATTGVSTMTGPIKAFSGAVAAPGIGFASNLGAGWFLSGSNEITTVVASVTAMVVKANREVDITQGLYLGNQNNADGTYLDWYEEGTFVPTLSFGGAAVGITYLRQLANYTRIGNIVHFSLEIHLTSKGSSTGDAFVAGLPYAASSVAPVDYALSIVPFTGVSTPTGGEMVLAEIVNGFSSIILSYRPVGGGTGNTVRLSEGDFSNSADMTITGFYMT